MKGIVLAIALFLASHAGGSSLTSSEKLIVDTVSGLSETGIVVTEHGPELSPEAAEQLIYLAQVLQAAEALTSTMPFAVVFLVAGIVPLLFKAFRIGAAISMIGFALMATIPLQAFFVLGLAGAGLSVALLFLFSFAPPSLPCE